MKKAIGILLFLLIALTISSCGNEKIESTNENRSDNNTNSSQTIFNMPVQKVTFPVSQKGKTEFNTAIYEIDPFTLAIALPEEWSIKEAEIPKEGEVNVHFLANGVFSIVDILNDVNECVGCIGYNTYDTNQSSEDNPITIYNQIALGNGYHFDAKDSYQLITTTETSRTAITNVLYSPAFMEGLGFERKEKTNKGILSYNKNLSVYIACELDKGKITDEEFSAIAKSIVFSKAKK
ncbi:hypothetical protein RBG61_03245 [Paludicola sp. MB14-C6]|uniref:hypothetical protein n=1 Tax=Paludihabitans sp. MB14-C6 TaxID=3070656 RepID=UPI0027DB16BD|nr:hypothetical protein [Paludicola sp. MB14-C6]WMJ23697.1 hypothetical protein RBG61_03245 [Paludicola sp. MB14-C6]